MRKLTKRENELKYKFINFLTANNALGNYNTELVNQIKHDVYVYFNELLITNLSSKKELLLYSFCWKQSKNGYKYWRELSDKWEKECISK